MEHVPVWKRAWEKYWGDTVFVGAADEHADFCWYVGPVAYYPTKDYLELAQVIAGSDFYIDNQSPPFWAAEGLKKRLVLEACMSCQNCRFERRGFTYGVNEWCALPDLGAYGRREWIDRTIDLFRSRKLSSVVEIGGIRDVNNAESDKHSTLAWATAAKDVYSVDIDPTEERWKVHNLPASTCVSAG